MAAVLRCYDVSRQSVCSFRFRDKRATQLVYIAVAAIFLSRSYASTTSVKWPDRTSSWLITVESYVYIYIYMYIFYRRRPNTEETTEVCKVEGRGNEVTRRERGKERMGAGLCAERKGKRE